ncbi:MAG: Gfo/Idh/MocA family oxidoreductase [Chloroflexota bacterium]|nr:Gfo/Idh/MocA family oxidoreductase [Chloroflexota bacterium]
MVTEAIRIGLIGAGRNTRDRHIPGFQKIPGVELVAVANRTRESGQRVADLFQIPTVHDSWRDLLDNPDVDAVCIGTWPYMHCTLAIAALDKGKHVLCEARMAANAQEAHAMLESSLTRPHLVAQIVPSPSTFKVDALLMKLISEGFLGNILAVEIQVIGQEFMDTESPMHWRQDRSLSGYNILNMGIWYEGMIRWVGPATRVMAMTKVNVPRRKGEDGNWQAVTVPDHADILCELANGGQAHMRFSAITGCSPGTEAWLYGSEGTIYIDQQMNVFGARKGEKELTEIPNPADGQHYWRVEQEFINAIRGEEPITRTPFSVGVHYMEFTEAVTRSAQTGQAIALPL